MIAVECIGKDECIRYIMSMKRENSFKKYLVKTMGTLWDVQSHEDRYSEGIPDLSFALRLTNGWIELKQIKAEPKTLAQIIKPEKYTSIQCNWIVKRQRKGGNCYVFVRVGKNLYYLFAAEKARMVRDGMTIVDYERECVKSWKRSIDKHELADVLTCR